MIESKIIIRLRFIGGEADGADRTIPGGLSACGGRCFTIVAGSIASSSTTKYVSPIEIVSPGWSLVNLQDASTEVQFQAIGVFCREALITLAQIVYDPSKHLTEDNVKPSKTDAKRMFSAYFSHELAGSSNEAVRRQAKATLDVANSLQHKRTANYQDAALCVEATTTIVNTGTVAIKEFKLVFSFPNLDIVPRKWILLGDQNESNKKLIQISPKGNTVEVHETGYLIQITYRSMDTLFPQDKLDISESIGLSFIINQSIYSNIEDMPPLSWKLYADNLYPKQGEIPLTQLNNY